MPIKYMAMIRRPYMKNHPEILFIWGDNMLRYGLGGQAKEMRGEPNGVPIVTKKAPTMDESAFFTDEDYALFKSLLQEPMKRLDAFLKSSKRTVICPEAGVGTDRAQLPQRAPECFNLLRTSFKVRGIYPPGWSNLP